MKTMPQNYLQVLVIVSYFNISDESIVVILMLIILTNISDNTTMREPDGIDDVHQEDNATDDEPEGIGHCVIFKLLCVQKNLEIFMLNLF
jgi:hypothetical protein